MATRANPPDESEPGPDGFRVNRELPVGRHPILDAFPRLDRLPPAARLVPDATARAALFEQTQIELVAEDVWMYVSPRTMPSGARRTWRPVVSPHADCIVVGEKHLRESPALMLFMDIYHELCHVLQRQGGADLWPPGVSYVQRWTEVEAYRFVVTEARRLGVSDVFLREYLRVEWISDEEHRELLTALGVPVS
jgi:hypothetical protein